MKNTIKTMQWQKVHVFISSTFNDMHAERDYLVKKVFPRLADWCEERKIRLVDIDLRWGVSEADTMNKKVVDTCLKNIDECRPFFICLLGQRRGWVPKKDDISADTYKDFSGIDGYAGNASVTEMEILHALIDPLHKNRPRDEKKKDEFYEPVKHAFFYLRDDSYLNSLPLTPELLRKTYTNESEEDLAEREIAEKELNDWRENKIPATKRPVHNYSAIWHAEAITPENRFPLACPSEDKAALKKWREQWEKAGIVLNDEDSEVPESLQEKANKFNVMLTQGRLGKFKSENKELGDVIYDDLKEAIRERFQEHIEKVESGTEAETDLQKEIGQQEQFVALNSVGFIERTGDFDQLDAYAANDSRKLFVLTAQAGMGKSMFLANWVERCKGQIDPEKNESLHFRFIGQSDKSTSFYNVWHTLLEEIKEYAGKLADDVVKDSEGRVTKVEAIPVDPVKLHNSLPDILKKIGAKGKTIIVLDALNQLDTGLKGLSWLQTELPEGIKMIVSFKRSSEDMDAEKLYGSLKDRAELSEIKPFESVEEREKLVEGYLDQYLKKLDQKHIKALLEIEASKNPLFLKVVLNELRIFGSFLNIKDKIRNDFGNDPFSAFTGVLKRLETDPVYTTIHPKIAVPLIYGLLAHSRFGLTTDELAHMLFTTLGYENRENQLKEIKESVSLYLRQVRPYLARKEGRYDFFYESFKLAARNRYVDETSVLQINNFDQEYVINRLKSEVIKIKTKDWHKVLAEYFYKLPLWEKRFSRGDIQKQELEVKLKADFNDDPNTRKVSELPFHLIKAEEWNKVELILCDLWFVEAKVRAKMVNELHQDYSEAISKYLGPQADNGKKKLEEIKLIKFIKKFVIFLKKSGNHPDPLIQKSKVTKVEMLKSAIPTTSYIWTQKEIKKECDRITRSSTCLDKLIAFDRYVNSQLYPFINYGSQPCFVQQHAFNFEPMGPIHSASVNSLSKQKNPVLLRRWPVEARYNPKPALIRNWKSDESWTYNIVFSSTRDRLVSISKTNILKLWDISNALNLHTFDWSHESNSSINVVPYGRFVVTVSTNNIVRVWDLEECRCIRDFEVPKEYAPNMSFTPDGRYAVFIFGKNLSFWDLENKKCLRIAGSHSFRFVTVVLCADGHLALTKSINNEIHLWDMKNGQCLRKLEVQIETVLCIDISLDCRFAVAGGSDGILQVWDLNSGQCKFRLQGHKGRINCVAITPDGFLAVSGGDDRTLHVWNLKRGQCLRVFSGNPGWVVGVAISHDGRYAVSSVMGDMVLRMWNIENGQYQPAVIGHKDEVTSVNITINGRYAVSRSKDKTLRIWNPKNGQCKKIYHKGFEDRGTYCLHVKPSLLHPVSMVTWGDKFRAWATCGRGLLCEFQGPGNVVGESKVRNVSVSSNGKYAALVGEFEKSINVLDLEKGKCLRILKGHENIIESVCLTADGKKAVSGGTNGTIRVWDTENGQCLKILKGHSMMVTGISITPDASRIVSGSWDSTVRVWDVQSGTCLHILKGHSGTIEIVGLTVDGRFAMSVGAIWDDDFQLRIWDLNKGKCMAIYLASDPIRSAALSPTENVIVLGTTIGEVIFLELLGAETTQKLNTQLL